MVRINLRSGIITSILVFVALCTSTFGKTIYVDDDATGANDGTSWENAYTFLQDALADANSAEKPVEIRVAQGIYMPDEGAIQTPGDREATFQLINGVTLIGGYASFGVPDPNGRDIDDYETILSGDLSGNDLAVVDPYDLLAEPTRAENCYHVATGSGTDATAVLDGFTITAGNADTNATSSSGGGMYNHASSPTVSNCTFKENSADLEGGGMYNYESRPSLTNCIFSNNNAYYGGGGMMNFYNGNPVLTNCTFIENSAEWGGGIHNLWDCNPMLTNCTFSSNSADSDGGGILNEENSNPNLNNCVFSSNSAYGNNGGGMYNLNLSNPTVLNCRFDMNWANLGGGMANTFQSNPFLSNCIFSGNQANGGGGMGNLWDSSPTLNNCTFSGNVAVYEGGGMYNSESSATLNNCTFNQNFADDVGGMFASWDRNSILTNCVLYGNNFPQIAGDATVSFSDVQDGWPGEGNIDVNPLFADPGYWSDINDPNIIVEPNDPNAIWIDGDYHLKSEAGRWDPNSESWIVDDVTSPCIDTGDPNSQVGDEPEPHGGIINMGAYGGTAEASMSPAGAEEIVYIQWLGHSTVKVWTDDCIVYIDPERVPESLHDATLVCVTHTHGDHYSPSDIAKVSNAETQFIAPPDVISQYGRGLSIAPWQAMEFDFVNIKAVPSYNTNKTNHPKSRNWVGYIIELGGKRIYVAGDTDLIDEMKSLGDIDVAFLPAGGTYTMNATEAAEATEYIKPDLAIPYHWGQSVGTLADAQRFVELARCPAMVLTVGETISSDDWPEYSPLIAHWALDEAEGDIAHDSAGENNGTLEGDPAWQPTGGKIDGALQLDGIGDYISTYFVVNPADGAFSVFAWIKGDFSGQVVISQADGFGSGETWLSADPSLGKLMTGLVPPAAGRFVPQPLVSESIITDGQWHHIGFVWDGLCRILYLDGAEVAKDTAAQNPLKSADGGLYVGSGKNLEAGTFFAGLIDDVRIYNVALTADEIETLVH